MRSFVSLVLFTLLFSCAKNRVTEPAGDSRCIPDSVCIDLTYQEGDLNGFLVVNIRVALINVSAETLFLDSTPKGTWLEIFPPESRISPIWESPFTLGTDTGLVALAPAETSFFADTWNRLDKQGDFVKPGNYQIEGGILSHRAEPVSYSEL